MTTNDDASSQPGSGEYPVYSLRAAIPQRPETLGTKEKYWVNIVTGQGIPVGPYLFKIGRPSTGENWSEKLGCELATLVGLPCARYELAEAEDGTRGVLSRSFVDSSSTLILGNMLLAKFEPGYDGARKFNQIKYTLGNVLSVLRRIKHIDPPIGVERLSGLEVFVGYLIFDAWIGNTDRHHENWGVIVSKFEEKGFSVRLTPTFDHASSLGRELSDESRAERLSTRDSRANVEAYALRAHSAFFDDEAGRKTLPMKAVLARLMRNYPRPTKFWAARICGLSSDEVRSVFSRMRRDWVSPQAEEFSIRLLAANARTIREVCLGG